MSFCLKSKLVLPVRWKESCSSVLVGMNIEAWVGNENGEPCVSTKRATLQPAGDQSTFSEAKPVCQEVRIVLNLSSTKKNN